VEREQTLYSQKCFSKWLLYDLIKVLSLEVAIKITKFYLEMNVLVKQQHSNYQYPYFSDKKTKFFSKNKCFKMDEI
jgi:hypothetical protein